MLQELVMVTSHPSCHLLLSPKEGYLGARLRQRRLLGKAAGSAAAAGGVWEQQNLLPLVFFTRSTLAFGVQL